MWGNRRSLEKQIGEGTTEGGCYREAAADGWEVEGSIGEGEREGTESKGEAGGREEEERGGSAVQTGASAEGAVRRRSQDVTV